MSNEPKTRLELAKHTLRAIKEYLDSTFSEEYKRQAENEAMAGSGYEPEYAILKDIEDTFRKLNSMPEEPTVNGFCTSCKFFNLLDGKSGDGSCSSHLGLSYCYQNDYCSRFERKTKA